MDVNTFLEYVNTHTAEEAAELLVKMRHNGGHVRKDCDSEVCYVQETDDECYEEGSPSEEWYNYYEDELD